MAVEADEGVRQAVRNALLRVAESIAKHLLQRSYWSPDDRCFELDLREAEREILAAVEGKTR